MKHKGFKCRKMNASFKDSLHTIASFRFHSPKW